MFEEELRKKYPPSGRSIMRKIDIEPRIHHLKKELYEGYHSGASKEWNEGAHYMLDRVLQILQEYYS